MQRLTLGLCVLLAQCAGLPCFQKHCGAAQRGVDDQPVMEAIENSWRRREQDVPRVIVHLEETRTYFRGSVSPASGGENNAIPMQDIVAAIESEFRCSGSDIRFDSDGMQYSGTLEQFVPMRRVLSHYKGIDKSYFFVKKQDGTQHYTLKDCPMGFEGESRQSINWMDPHFYPMVAHLRPLSPGFRRFKLGECRVASKNAKIGTTTCVVITTNKKGDSPYSYEYWLDPARDYILLRSHAKTFGVTDLVVDIKYQPATKDGHAFWIPRGWISKSFLGESMPAWQGDVKVVSFEFPDKVDTQFKFPAGTLVTRIGGNTAGSAYLVRKDGSKRPITAREQAGSVAYEQLLETEPGGLEANSWHRSVIFFNIIGVVCIIILALVVKSRRKEKSDQ